MAVSDYIGNFGIGSAGSHPVLLRSRRSYKYDPVGNPCFQAAFGGFQKIRIFLLLAKTTFSCTRLRCGMLSAPFLW